MTYLLLWHPKVTAVTDVATVYFDLQPSGTETPELTDAATVYLDITIISTIPASMDLEVVGMGKRFVCSTQAQYTHEMARRFVLTAPQKRYTPTLTENAARWIDRLLPV